MRASVSLAGSSNVSRKGKKKLQLHDSMMLDLSAGFDVDGESSGFEQSLDEEFGIPAIRTLRAKKAQSTGKASGSYPRPHKSRRERVLVQRQS